MVHYGDLESGGYYLIRENENGSIELAYIAMVTEKAVLVEYEDSEKTRLWHLKTDTFFEVIEKFSPEAQAAYEKVSSIITPGGAGDDEFDWDEDDDDMDDNDGIWIKKEDEDKADDGLGFPYKN